MKKLQSVVISKRWQVSAWRGSRNRDCVFTRTKIRYQSF